MNVITHWCLYLYSAMYFTLLVMQFRFIHLFTLSFHFNINSLTRAVARQVGKLWHFTSFALEWNVLWSISRCWLPLFPFSDLQVEGFHIEYLSKVSEVKDTSSSKQSLLFHLCSIIREQFPDSTDFFSEIGTIKRCAKVSHFRFTFYKTASPHQYVRIYVKMYESTINGIGR